MTQRERQPDRVRVFRAVHDRDNPYFMTRRDTAQDKTLPYECLGLLNYVLSKPDDWEIMPGDLEREGCKKDRVYRILGELIKRRYIQRIGLRKHGKFHSVVYNVYEQPYTEKPDTVKPDAGSSDATKPTPQNTEGDKVQKSLNTESFSGGSSAAAPEEVIEETRPKIYTLYEQNFGLLTDLIRDLLVEAQQEYPAAWIEEAVTIAVKANARRWDYVEAILKRWKREGKDSSREPQTSKRTSSSNQRRAVGSTVEPAAAAPMFSPFAKRKETITS